MNAWGSSTQAAQHYPDKAWSCLDQKVSTEHQQPYKTEVTQESSKMKH